MQLPSEGTRISLSGHLGSVKYVGSVDNTVGIWLGIEWDDPTKRGKHDGVKDGKRYFSCRIPGAGSFIRPSSSINYGVSFLHALTSKYVELPHSATQETILLGSSNGAIEVEAVGMDKIRGKFADLQRLREVSLDNALVARCDPAGEVGSTCPNVRGLDISASLLPSWEMVALITTELPLLEMLSLNRNRLRVPFDVTKLHSAFMNLRELHINGTMTLWQEMEGIVIAMPRLTVIEMGYNHLTVLECREDSLRPTNSSIQVINLDSNECHDWSQMCCALQRYAGLRRLILTLNRFSSIPKIPNATLTFSNLGHLSLSFNCLKAWSDVDQLSRWCPTLQTLNIAGNPITEDARISRQMTIARMPTIVLLDGVHISPKERTDCELFYLSHVRKHGPSSEEARRHEHPRWEELCAKHGRQDDSSRRTGVQDKLSNRLVQVHLYESSSPLEAESLPRLSDLKSTSVRVLPKMTLRTFRLKALKTIKTSSRTPSLASARFFLQMVDGTLAELSRDHDDQDLAWWGIEDASIIVFYVYPSTE